eukprot:TRINITY_DN57559_c0_g1_i1.p1 TRINITY_DN57559_c0_g1~~TRINITY_DN57559_c0_g1_i1.p1  ORF type:complete len:413 (+),score=65.07 TRINITY_DN57559_c0_g1_i1:45-1241(+)
MASPASAYARRMRTCLFASLLAFVWSPFHPFCCDHRILRRTPESQLMAWLTPMLPRGWRGTQAKTCARAAVADTGETEPGPRFLPALDFSLTTDLEPSNGSLVLPCFPLGGDYLPNSKGQVLNIFEPRYRKMYNDILLSGGRRFVVPPIKQDEESGAIHLAEVGVVFYLDDLQEVSEQTDDQVKYVCSHSIVSRVRLKRVLNPRAFADRSTYLRVEAEELVDTDDSADLTDLENQVREAILELGDLQRRADAEVKFADRAIEQVNVTRSVFWEAVSLWDQYTAGLLQHRQQKFTRDVQLKIQELSKDPNFQVSKPAGFDELPLKIRKDLVALQQQFEEEVGPLVKQRTNQVQELIQSTSHFQRLSLLEGLVADEKKRLGARLALKSLFEEKAPGQSES